MQINNSLTSYTSKCIEIVKQVVFVKCLGHKYKFMNINLRKLCDSKIHEIFIFNALVINSFQIAVTWMESDILSMFLDNEAGIAVYFCFLTHMKQGSSNNFFIRRTDLWKRSMPLAIDNSLTSLLLGNGINIFPIK